MGKASFGHHREEGLPKVVVFILAPELLRKCKRAPEREPIDCGSSFD